MILKKEVLDISKDENTDFSFHFLIVATAKDLEYSPSQIDFNQ
jgi:hypothetical protein